MRKNALALSIATMIGGLGLVNVAIAGVIAGTGTVTSASMGATNASQLQVAAGGIGHILVVPYFNAQNGNITVISLVNTDETNGKALKVRFRGAANSDDILDFTLLMSPGDVWTGYVDSAGGSGARFTTQDRSCTYPDIRGVTTSFVQNRLDSTLSAADLNNNTREGYIEIFNMADIPPLTYASNSPLYNTIKHSGGVPACSTTVLDAALLTDVDTAGSESVAAARGLATPTTGLMGNWTIMNVPQTTNFAGTATAIRALSSTVGAGVDGRGNYVLFPQSASNANTPDNFTADPSLRVLAYSVKNNVGAGTTAAAGTPVITAAFYDLPDLSTPYITNAGLATAIAGAALGTETAPRAQASILTTALAVQSIKNEYANDTSVTARTDWVFSMPTRRYSVALAYGSAATRVFSIVPTAGLATEFFHSTNTSVVSRKICVNSDGQKFWDREETTKSSGAVLSPGNVSVTNFCGETSVLSFNAAGLDSVLSATVARQDTGTSAFVNGWGTVNVTNGGPGLPIVGSAFLKLTNPQAGPGTSGTYGSVFDHRYTR
jgi:hypothetical protein